MRPHVASLFKLLFASKDCVQALRPMRALLCLQWPHRCFLDLRPMKDEGMRNKGWFPSYRFLKAEVVGNQKTLLNLSQLSPDELCVGAETFC